MPHVLESMARDLATKSLDEKRAAIREAVHALPNDQKEALADALRSNVPPPDQSTSNTVWLIIIWAFVVVMVSAVLTLCVSVFWSPIKDGTKPEIILTVFTTVTGFLAGLFAPSPVKPKE